MAKNWEILGYLRPNGGYVQVGETYEGITFEPQCEPFTKEEYQAAFAQYDAWKADQNAKAAADKAALLTKLGINADEAKLLLS
jgi:hypothetical protein